MLFSTDLDLDLLFDRLRDRDFDRDLLDLESLDALLDFLDLLLSTLLDLDFFVREQEVDLDARLLVGFNDLDFDLRDRERSYDLDLDRLRDFERDRDLDLDLDLDLRDFDLDLDWREADLERRDLDLERERRDFDAGERERCFTDGDLELDFFERETGDFDFDFLTGAATTGVVFTSVFSFSFTSGDGERLFFFFPSAILISFA